MAIRELRARLLNAEERAWAVMLGETDSARGDEELVGDHRSMSID
jgi:hypothetical protein